MTKVDEQTIERVAKAIRDQNRRHMHISNPSLTFDRDTLTADELNLALAAIAAIPDTPAKARNDALREAADAAFQRLRVWVWDCDQNSDFAKQRKATDIEVRDVILALIDKENTL